MRAAAIFSHDVLDKQVGCCSESTRLRFYLEIFNYDSICVTLNSSPYFNPSVFPLNYGLLVWTRCFGK